MKKAIIIVLCLVLSMTNVCLAEETPALKTGHVTNRSLRLEFLYPENLLEDEEGGKLGSRAACQKSPPVE